MDATEERWARIFSMLTKNNAQVARNGALIEALEAKLPLPSAGNSSHSSGTHPPTAGGSPSIPLPHPQPAATPLISLPPRATTNAIPLIGVPTQQISPLLMPVITPLTPTPLATTIMPASVPLTKTLPAPAQPPLPVTLPPPLSVVVPPAVFRPTAVPRCLTAASPDPFLPSALLKLPPTASPTLPDPVPSGHIFWMMPPQLLVEAPTTGTRYRELFWCEVKMPDDSISHATLSPQLLAEAPASASASHYQELFWREVKMPDDSISHATFELEDQLVLEGDYYTVHGENASFIAKTYYRTTTALRQLGNATDGIPSVSVNRNMFENIARDVLLHRTDHTVEVYEGSGSNWRLTKAGTPGNIGAFEDVLFANNDMQDAPVTIALFPSLRENQCIVGLSYVDMTNQRLGLAEFLDDSQFTNVESVLVALGCKECLLPVESGKSIEFKNLHGALDRCGVLLTERKKTEFKSRDLVQDLGRIIKGSIETVRELLSEFQHALSALGALVSYTDLLADDYNYGNYTIQKYSLNRYMRLDSSAIRALNILESKTDANKNFSLLGLMNRTCTAGMGKRLLNKWLKQPLLDVDEINCRLDLVQAFVDDVELRKTVRQQLKKIPDIERLTHNLRKRAANLSPVIKLYQASLLFLFHELP
ncbi:DNA mismatch repair protein MSH2 [Platanthera zijinensis]|uniref:DNA mismatch repair protein MSH2 n=1 Tax=Platanthera zijinensis TaxID=2320716 RepID=A0AAP0C1I6_9ASPA